VADGLAARGIAAVVTAAAFWWNRQIFFWGALAFVTLLPTSNFVVTIGSIMAERFLYLPSIGVVACFVAALFAIARRYRLTGWAVAALAAMTVGLGARTAVRNADWADDVTLAAATVRAVPASYKAHRQLAGALYDADADHARIGAAIAEASRAIAIIDPLPDAMNAGEMFLQAGQYQVEKGEQAWRTGEPDLPSIVAPERRQPYLNAIPLLRRAEAIGQAQQHARPDEGFAPHYASVYRLLSVALLRVGDVQPALDAAVRARAIAPLEPDAYARVAEASLAVDRPDAAAIALTEGLMITAAQPFAEALLNLYRAGLDPDGCAVLAAGAGTTFDPRCPTVRRHVCAAAAEAVPMLRLVNQRERAERIRATAVGSFGCVE
jgi:tetratricopeptide (TPR) repeat protein